MLSLIDRYLLKQFFINFFVSLISSLALFVTLDFLSKLSRYKASTGIMLEYFLYYSPEALHQMVPLACFFQ